MQQNMLQVHTCPLPSRCSMSERAEITRYPNRRLYDRSRKKYVTLGDIEAMVLDGQDVRVRDSKSDEDLTRVILIQIILERHPERVKMFPVAFLHGILRADQMALNWLTVYFGQAMPFMKGITGTPGTTLVPGMNFWQSLIPGVAKRANDSSTATREEPVPDDEAQAQQELAAKLVEMEHRLKQLEGGSSPHDSSPDESGA